MSRVLYFDCFSGISGDMILGAFLDAGLPLADLRGALGSLALDGYEVSAERVLRAGVSATKFLVREYDAAGVPSSVTSDAHGRHAITIISTTIRTTTVTLTTMRTATSCRPKTAIIRIAASLRSSR
jgi:uncharacterized protein (DUF111 family)